MKRSWGNILESGLRSLFLLIFGTISTLNAQLTNQPAAKFSFNNGKDYDEITKNKAKLVGVNFIPDRFGNENHAVVVYGNQSSYINLGNYAALKPSLGSISLWVKMDVVIHAGQGHQVNPIILTKNTASKNDFYESYAIYYNIEGKNISGAVTQDSLKQITVDQTVEFTRYKWQHLVLTFSNKRLSFYINGELIGELATGFTPLYNKVDSVLLGVTANKKNSRYFKGAIDDIEFYNKILTNAEVKQLYNAPNPNKNKLVFYWVLICLGITLIILGIYFLVKYQLSLTLKKEKQRLEQLNIILETELRVNRALMNPHFVFNSLNALQNFILKNENARANNYLVKFSKLMRRILESNMADSITLEFEIQLLKSYLEIEDLRFEENIKYEIFVDAGIIPSTIKIPIMMLQPFVENAIWHGLLKKKGEKLIHISFSVIENTYVLCTIEDNGTGRKPADVPTVENSSLATSFIEQRLDLLNRIHHLSCGLTIEDKPNAGGTIVRIKLPVLKN